MLVDRDAEKRALQMAKAKKEKERQERERQERDETGHITTKDLAAAEKNNKDNETSTVDNTDVASDVKKRHPRKERLKDKESHLREINNKYKLDPVEKLNKENEDETKSTRKTKSPRPDSGVSSSITHSVRYPGSILHNRDPVYGYHRKDKRPKVGLLTYETFVTFVNVWE